MKKSPLIILGTLAAIAAAALPATAAAHGDEPDDVAAAVAMALKSPLVLKGSAHMTIAHVENGCHVLSNGKVLTNGKAATAAGARVLLKRGQRLTLLNQDLDTHKLVRLAGPKIALGKPLAMNDRMTLVFRKPGVYKLRTKKIEVPGMPEVETAGADNILALLVVVR